MSSKECEEERMLQFHWEELLLFI